MTKPTDAAVNPLTFGVLWRGLIAAANDAGVALRRTAYSEAVREGRDFSVGLFDHKGRMIVQGDFSPGHLGSMPSVVENVLAYYPIDDLRPGDGILLNDLYMGSGHLPDFLLVSPIFFRDQLVGFAVSCVHMIDVGGAVPGSQAVIGIRDHYQEGIRFLPTRVWSSDKPNQEILRLLEANVRVPGKLLGDLKAMRNCNRIASERLTALLERYGIDVYKQTASELLARSEEEMRSSIGKLPDGAYHAVDWFDDYGPETEAIRVEATVTIDGDSLTIDYAGSGPQTPSGINGVLNFVRAYSYFVVKCITHGASLPQNAGSLAPIEVVAPEGSIANAQPPAGAGARAIMQQRFVDVLMQAFAPVCPGRIVAPSSHWANPVVGGVDPRDGHRFVFYDVIVGGFGGRDGLDGVEAMCPSFNIDGIPTEINEHSYPILVERVELIQDSAGPGTYRGGHGLRKDMRLIGEDLQFSNLAERHRFAPAGVFGGEAGALGATVLNPGSPEERILHSKGQYSLQRGDLVSMRVSGGGGYGDPLDRDPERVLRDVREELLSAEKARSSYGVVVTESLDLDVEATSAERARRNRSEEKGSLAANA